jgi:hypothetical protein
VTEVLDGVHRLVAVEGLQVVGGVEARRLADVAQDGVRLCDLLAVDIEHRQRVEPKGRLHLPKFGTLQSDILEVDAADMKGDPDRLAPASVEIEIGELESGHGAVSPFGLNCRCRFALHDNVGRPQNIRPAELEFWKPVISARDCGDS